MFLAMRLAKNALVDDSFYSVGYNVIEAFFMQ